MTVSYFVRYRGEAENPKAFTDFYRRSHAPLLWKFPGLRDLVLHHRTEFSDPFPVNPGGDLVLAQMVFDTAEDLNRALASEARAAARDDFARFPDFTGEVTHQAMRAEAIGR